MSAVGGESNCRSRPLSDLPNVPYLESSHLMARWPLWRDFTVKRRERASLVIEDERLGPLRGRQVIPGHGRPAVSQL